MTDLGMRAEGGLVLCMVRKEKGLSLLELLLVITIIGIIASFAIPYLQESRALARENAALSAVRSVATAQMSYSVTRGYGKYAPDLNTLGASGMIDSVLASGTKGDYTFSVSGTDATFSINARRGVYGSSGSRSFYADESGVIRFTTADRAATTDDPPLGQ